MQPESCSTDNINSNKSESLFSLHFLFFHAGLRAGFLFHTH